MRRDFDEKDLILEIKFREIISIYFQLQRTKKAIFFNFFIWIIKFYFEG